MILQGFNISNGYILIQGNYFLLLVSLALKTKAPAPLSAVFSFNITFTGISETNPENRPLAEKALKNPPS